MGQSLVESLIFKESDLTQNITFQGLHHLKTAIDRGKGVIILTAHFGAWEIGGNCIGRHLKNLKIIYKPLKNPYVNRFLIHNREKQGFYQLVRDKEALKHLLRHLKKENNTA